MSRELGVDLIPGQTLRTLADVEQMGLVEKEQTITEVRRDEGAGSGIPDKYRRRRGVRRGPADY
jgi:hypothetical protein